LNASGVIDLERTISSTRFTRFATLGRSTTPLLIIYSMTLHGGYIQMTLFPKLPSGSPKIGILVVLKLWTLISLSKQACLDCTRKISYNVQKDLFNGVLHAPIKYHLIPSLRGFVVGSQIFNLILDLSFDHNLCILGLNE
jgi:hypothetical protein